MTPASRVEKFSVAELTNLRRELLHSGLDSWQAAEVISGFLTGRGYGTDTQEVRSAVLRIESAAGNLDRMQEELEKIAYPM